MSEERPILASGHAERHSGASSQLPQALAGDAEVTQAALHPIRVLLAYDTDETDRFAQSGKSTCRGGRSARQFACVPIGEDFLTGRGPALKPTHDMFDIDFADDNGVQGFHAMCTAEVRGKGQRPWRRASSRKRAAPASNMVAPISRCAGLLVTVTYTQPNRATIAGKGNRGMRKRSVAPTWRWRRSMTAIH